MIITDKKIEITIDELDHMYMLRPEMWNWIVRCLEKVSKVKVTQLKK